MKIKKKYLNLFLILAIIVTSIFAFSKVRMDRKMEYISSNIEQKVSRIIELSTIVYNYTDVVSYKENLQVNGLGLPFTNKSFIIKYSGYIKAGVDLESLKFNIIDKESIKISMDKAKVLENVIIEEEVKFFNEQDGLFNKLSFKDLYGVLIGEKEKSKDVAIKKGLLNEAEKNGEEIIRSLLEEMGFKNIDIEFKRPLNQVN